jgi:hydrocephalus-inducing protein
MSIEPLYEKSAHLDVRIASGQVVLPYKTEVIKDKKGHQQTVESNVLKIPIVFTPRDCIRYNETVSFDINGLNRIDVEIKGEGVPFKLEVEKTENQNIDFGITKVGE